MTVYHQRPAADKSDMPADRGPARLPGGPAAVPITAQVRIIIEPNATGSETSPSIGLDEIDRMTGGRLGTFDTTCPLCSHLRHSAKNRSAKVLRIYRT